MTATNISWACFENCNANRQGAFENMCRLLFKHSFLAPDDILTINPNNPGVEIEPVYSPRLNMRISYQAKYFDTRIGYSQISHSMDKTIEYYKGKIDRVYLYCNRGITLKSAAYKAIKSKLDDNGIELIPICNEAILDAVIEDPIVSSAYFHLSQLTDKWFHDMLEDSLVSLGDRYNGEFNVTTPSEDQLNLFLRNSQAVAFVNRRKEELNKRLYDARWKYHQNPLYAKMKRIVDDIPDITATNIDDCVCWHSKLTESCRVELLECNCLIDEKEQQLVSKEHPLSPNEQKRIQKEILDLRELIGYPSQLVFEGSEKALLRSRVLIVKGDAGTGKSQLFANAAERSLSVGQPAVLLLGMKFISDNLLEEQLVRLLRFNESTDILLSKLEAIGECKNQLVCIYVDALNESANKQVWKTGLHSFILRLSKYEHLRLAISFRNKYDHILLGNSVDNLKSDGTIAEITHSGFLNVSLDATATFMNHYNIPFLPSYSLHPEMTNPLFLTLFCKYYNGDTINIESLLNQIKQKAEEEVRIATDQIEGLSTIDKFISSFIEKRLVGDMLAVSEEQLLTLDFWPKYGLEHCKSKYISALHHCGFLGNTIIGEEEFYFFSYQRFDDYLCAQHIVKKYSSSQELLLTYIQNEVLQIQDGKITSYLNLDVIILVCHLYAQKYGVELIDDLLKNISDSGEQYDLATLYIKSYSFRNMDTIRFDFFKNLINTYHCSSNDVFDVFIENSTKENHPFNADALHNMLKKMPLAKRDYLWTIRINACTYDESRIYQLVSYYDQGNVLDTVSTGALRLLLVLFAWLLTSSNRHLRDKTTKAMVEILKNNFELCAPLLQQFEAVNDPYVLQRLYAAVFGACVKRKSEFKAQYCQLIKQIYAAIFDKESVYPDILLRDYARLIIERYVYEYPEVVLSFPLSKIRPPYRSEDIPLVEKQEYYDYGAKNSGMNLIDFSMRIDDPSSPGMYGDFGRYRFQSALKNFKDLDVLNCYHYAMQFIRDELGYSDKLFSDEDRFRMYHTTNRHANSKIERVGKKYQWIAMYNILARVSDRYPLAERDDVTEYSGPWEPFVRDFDPTLNHHFVCPPSLPEIVLPTHNEDLFAEHEELNQEQIIEWLEHVEPFHRTLPQKLFQKGSDDDEWIFLYLYEKVEKRPTSDAEYYTFTPAGTRIKWLTAEGYLVSKNKKDALVTELNRALIDEDDIPRSYELYQIFNREYGWAPSFQRYLDSYWFDLEAETGNVTKVIHQMPRLVDSNDEFGFELVFEPVEIVEKETYVVGQIMPAYCCLRWEQEYDASQSETKSYHVPCGEIINHLKLSQKECDGYYYNQEGKLAAFDLSLSGEIDGLVIRRSDLCHYLEENNLDLLWVCHGEKQYCRGDSKQTWRDWEGVLSFDGNNISGEINMRIPRERC